MTVEPTIVDPDYTYIQITANVLYDPKKTNLTAGQIQASVKTAISNLAATNLNTFNSTFSATDFTNAISSTNPAIITNEISIKLQKKFYKNFPILAKNGLIKNLSKKLIFQLFIKPYATFIILKAMLIYCRQI